MSIGGIHPQQEVSRPQDSCSLGSMDPTTLSSRFVRCRDASFQMQPQPMFATEIAFPKQFFAHAVQLVQSSALAKTAGPLSGSSHTLNGQTSRQSPHRLHFTES